MYSKEIEEFIDYIIEDGVITDKERAVLHKKAIAEGIDIDEIDIVVEARLERKKKASLPPPPPPFIPPVPPTPETMQSGNNLKHGTVKKCPNCGAVVESGSVSCGECGFYYQNIEANNSAQRFAQMLRDIEKRFEDNSANTENFNQFLWGSFATSPRQKALCRAIETFPVPTTKDDLMEFILYIAPKANQKVKMFGFNPTDPYEAKIIKSYKAKYTECINKASFFFGDDPQFKELLKQKR